MSTLRDIHAQRLLILDFGSQYTQLIARRVRESGVYCEIYPFDITAEQIAEFAPAGVILSGGPETVTEGSTPRIPEKVFQLQVPVLGICYGLQAMAAQLGGAVASSDKREFGHAQIQAEQSSQLGCHGLQAVANAKHRHLQLKNFLGYPRCRPFGNGFRTTG